MIGETWGNMLRMFISRGLFHTHANTVPHLQLYFQQGQNLTTICQQCTKTCHSSYASAFILNRSLLCANPWISRLIWSCLLLTGGDKQLYEYIVKAPEAGLKAHRCTLCGQTGNDRSNLRKHVENIHFPGAFSYTCKYCPPEMAAKTFPTRTKLQNHVSSFHKSFPLCSSDWSVNWFQDLGTVSQIQKNYFNLCRKMKTRTLDSISGYAPSVGRGSSAELLWGTTVRASTLRACSSTTVPYVRRRCLLRVPSTIMWLFITTRQRCWVAPNPLWPKSVKKNLNFCD